MKWFRWITCFLPAFGIALGLMIIVASLDDVNKFIDRNIIYYWIFHLSVDTINFFLFTFLSCYFVPAPKKFAALLATIITLSLFALGACVGYNENHFNGSINMTTLFINFIGIASGLSIGIVFSHWKFNNKGWNSSNDNGVLTSEVF